VTVGYIQPGFAPTNTDWDADEFSVAVDVGFPLTDEDDDTQIDVTLEWDYAMDAAFAANTNHEIGAELGFVIDADAEEEAMVAVTYDVLTGGVDLEAEYVNLPLGDEDDTEFVLSAHGEYAMLTGDYVAVATLVYDFEEDMTLTLEGRVDSDGAAMYSAEAWLDYEVAENTDIYVAVEYNDWDDDINDWDEFEIVGTDTTVIAGIDVEF
jgi:predicted porin